MAEINALFEKEHPEIKLEFEVVPPNDAYVQALSPQFLAGDAPDVVMTDAPKMTAWAESGYLEPLADSTWADDVDPNLKPFTTVDGELYGFPMEQIGIGIFANMDMLAAAAVDAVPTNWSDFTASLEALQAAGQPGLNLPNKAGWTGRMLLTASAASLVYPGTSDLDEKILLGEETLDPTWVGALDQVMELQDLGFVDWPTQLGVDEFTQGKSDFIAGNSAYWFQGAWNLQSMIDEGVNVAFAPWPGADSGTSHGLLFPGTMWSVNASSDVKDAAAAYLEFWNDPEVLGLYLDAENAFTTFTGGTSPDKEQLSVFSDAFDAGDVAYTPVSTWMVGDALTAVNSNVQSRMLGDVESAAALEAIDDAVSRLR
ncbi:hypothetical protein GCM10025768_05670 [Microbacterium pseudoresistens]|uniref:Raffinose/stachyose/melibiose transport system substrate-binding protein n=1 Tax=Microbacterium pseudoresistens TaxID=640634 RepID=A0A7Y9EUW4_9MICO|nr:extracellular solute-binding protein [Microbacterium pseudoresistens]NYD54403.1 raffinose/stachyose/melibiose transport system substrate-binding protein [Microbacterium pseudoresistens]